MQWCDGGEGADGVGGGRGSHRGEGRRRRGRRKEDATRSERGEHIDVHRHSFPPHSTLVVRDGDVKRGDERVTRDSECGVEGGEEGMHEVGLEGGGGKGREGGLGYSY